MPRAFSVVLADDPVSSGQRLLASLAQFDLEPMVAHAVSAADAMALLGVAPCDLLVVGAHQPDHLADRLLERVGHDGAAPPLVLVVPGPTPTNDAEVLRTLRGGAWDYIGSDDVTRFAATVERVLDHRLSVRLLDDAAESPLRARRERDQLRLQGMQKMEAVGRLAGGIAHDFNNIVQAIGGYSELLQDSLAADDPRRGTVDEILRAGDRAAALTRQLLAFSRQQVMQPRVLDLNEVVATVESLLVRLIGEDVTLTARLSPELWSVRADPMQLEQVLMNLVVNARDAMPAGGSVTIETENTTLDPSAGTDAFSVTRGPYVLLSVTDTGQGMAPDVRARAFEPFFTTKELGRGTGLGLSTVYGIVKQTGGYIWVDSEPGRGTRVRIYLPRDAAAPVRLVDHRQPARRDVRRGHETVMVVEDEDGVRELMQAWLESHGYRVLTAGNGVEALQTSADFDGPIDLVVADMVMPAMGGPALVRKLKPLRPELKVMFMSGYADATPGDRDVLDEPTMFLQKPFALALLVDKVREALDAAPASTHAS
jgi:signal transduction histidine kinase/ActR/RegA family two-component response regulator